MKTRRQKRAARRSRERVTTYLYGSDREGVLGSPSSFATCGGGAVQR